jgi:hypothetical protein
MAREAQANAALSKGGLSAAAAGHAAAAFGNGHGQSNSGSGKARGKETANDATNDAATAAAYWKERVKVRFFRSAHTFFLGAGPLASKGPICIAEGIY